MYFRYYLHGLSIITAKIQTKTQNRRPGAKKYPKKYVPLISVKWFQANKNVTTRQSAPPW